ncbi:MAG TPA: PhoH family protein [Kofleriaceae bacterium]|nr:PhoH family protein [Kofleriaceae bacterium]
MSQAFTGDTIDLSKPLPAADSDSRDKLTFDDPAALAALCGQHSKKLKLIARAAGVELHLRGNEVTVVGDGAPVSVAREVLTQLYGFAKRGTPLGSDDMVRAVRAIEADRTTELRSIFGDTVFVPRTGRPIVPKGLAQKAYVDSIRRRDLVFGIGPAGTGKTYLAMAMAVKLLSDKAVKRIVLTRPAVEAGERLGFLPGSLEEKINPYLRPLYDALHDMLDFDRTRRLVDQGVIEIAPLAFMRGRTLNDSFVILDEAQNASTEQMKMFLTRLGFGSKAVVTGDITQSDLPASTRSGLAEARDILDRVRGIDICYFTEADVVRHPLVQDIIRAYDRAARRKNGNGNRDGGNGGGGYNPTNGGDDLLE